MNVLRTILAAREAGNVLRCHTIPHHGEYSVALHCYNVVSLLFILHPDPSVNLIKAALWHDAGERWVGDIPAPAKWASPELDTASKVAEHIARDKFGLNGGELSEEDRGWLGVLDALEFWFWCLDQEALGNQHINNARRAIRDRLNREDLSLYPGVWQVVRTLAWTRLEEA